MGVKIPLFQGTLDNITGSLQRWATELRKLPFIFEDDFQWTNYAAASGTTSGTWTGVQFSYSRYMRTKDSGLCAIQVYASGTTAGAPGGLTFTLPFTATSRLAAGQLLAVPLAQGGAPELGAIFIPQGSNVAQVYTRTGAAWGNGASREFYGNFFYSVD